MNTVRVCSENVTFPRMTERCHIRPIAIGEMWRRCAGRKIFGRLANEVGNGLAESGGQFGLGISAGGEVVHHALDRPVAHH